MVDIKHLKAHDCPTVDAIIPFFCSNVQISIMLKRLATIMDHKVLQVSKRSIPQTEGTMDLRLVPLS